MKLNYLHTEIDEHNYISLVKEESSYEIDKRYKYDTPDKISKIPFALNHHKRAEEYVYCLYLDASLHTIAIFEISHGAVNFSIAQPREIFQRALLCGAHSFAIWHNHPSGDPTPSEMDLKITKRLVEAGEIMGINLIDHIIVAPNHTYISLKEHGYMN